MQIDITFGRGPVHPTRVVRRLQEVYRETPLGIDTAWDFDPAAPVYNVAVRLSDEDLAQGMDARKTLQKVEQVIESAIDYD